MDSEKYISEIKGPTSLTERVYERLENAIINLEIKPGQVIQEPELARQLGISVTPVREAINRLIGDGFLVRKSRRTRVTQFSRSEIEDLYEVRAHLEVLAVEKAISNMTDEDIEYLKRLQEKGEGYVRSHDADGYEEYNSQFHSKIRSMSKNRLLIQLIDTMMKKNRLVMSSQAHTTPSHKWASAVKEHMEIVGLIEKRDTQKAKAAMRKHIDTANRLFLDVYLEDNLKNSDEMQNNLSRAHKDSENPT